MWDLRFDNTTKRGLRIAPPNLNDTLEGEFSVMRPKEQCAWFLSTPTRYQYVDGVFSEFPGWETEQAEETLTQWRNSTKCGPLQLRRALRASGLMDTVKTHMGTADEEVVEAWEYATEIYRMDPMVLGIQALLGKTDTEADDLFRLALTFN